MVIIVVVVGGMAYWGYTLSKRDKEKCGHLGDGYTYVEGSGCVLKSVISAEREYVNQLKEAGTYDEVVEESRKKTRDVMFRVNRIRQLMSALTLYKNQKSEYPKTLEQLVQSGVLSDSSALYDPGNAEVTIKDSLFSYAVKLSSSGKAIEYHLGASMEICLTDTLCGTQGPSDANFNSKNAGWLNGFDGNNSNPCKSGDVGKFCYDVKAE